MTDAALVALPVGIPWLTAVLVAFLDGRKRWVGWLAAAGLAGGLASLALLTAATLRRGTLTTTAGGWPVDVGITLRADALGVTFATVSVVVILAALVYEVFLGVSWRAFPALALFIAAGICGLCLTGDAFNFYVFFEVAMTASFVLASYREADESVRGAFVFAVVNLLGSVLFLSGVAALYSVTGSLDMVVIAERAALLAPGTVIVIAAIIFAAFCLKLGLFPFHFWLPTVYVGVHAPVAAILSGALANIGAYGLLRFGGGLLPRELEFGSPALLVLGAVSVLYGSVQALSRRDAAEVLSYSAIGQAGYVLLALGVGGPAGYAAAVLYAVLNALNKGVLFLAAGVRGPLTGAAFAVGAFSVCGVPPLAGFLGKVAVLRAGAAAESPGVGAALAVLVVLGGALSFLYAFGMYQRRYLSADAKADPKADAQAGPPDPLGARVLVAALAALLLLLGVWPEPLIALSQAAAEVLTGTP